MKFFASLLALGLLLAPPGSQATVINWTNAAGGDWNMAQNWKPNKVPGSNDAVTIGTTSIQYNVVVSVTNSSEFLTLNNGSSLTVLSNAVLNLYGGASIDGPLTNWGTVTALDGPVELNYFGSSTGVVWNNAGALWDMQTAYGISGNPSSPVIYHNFGQFRTSVTVVPTTISFNFDNQGVIHGQSGQIDFENGGDLSGTFYGLVTVGDTIGGTISGAFSGTNTLAFGLNADSSWTVLTNGVLNLIDIVDIAGALTKLGTVNWQNEDAYLSSNCDWNPAGAVWNIQCDQTFWVQGAGQSAGLIRKSLTTGTTTFTFSLTNQGTLEADTGLMEFTNGYVSTPAANLLFVLGGLTPGTNFGQVQIDVAPVLGGAFTVVLTNGYRPNPGDSFQVLSYPSATGDFTSMNGLDLGGGLRLEPHFNPQGLTLVAATYPTNAAPVLSLFHANSGMLISWPAAFNAWQLYSTPDLANPNWTPVTVSGQNNTILSNVQQQFFRLQAIQ